MTKKSAIVLALGMMVAILSAAVAMSVNFGIGTQAESAPLVKTSPAAKKAEKKQKPIVKTRTVRIERERPAAGGGGAVTVVRSAPSSTGGNPAVRSSGNSGSSSFEDDHGEQEDHEDHEDHEDEHEEHEGGDD